jgi:Glycosyl hydrolases family 32 N-terminal domain
MGMKPSWIAGKLLALIILQITSLIPCSAQTTLCPKIQGDWRTIASSPDLGELTSSTQQPVDFAIWQAADDTWQLWSCIRGTKEIGKTRLFYCWEGQKLTDANWKPMGIAMRAETKFGETPGGLQAPFVFKNKKLFYMVYGDWENICLATSADGKHFSRQNNLNGKPALFTEGQGNNTRDPMVIRIGNLWHCYYTAYPNKQGSVYCRTSKDFVSWNEPHVVAFGGSADTGPFSAECPFVVQPQKGNYFLFRTQHYGNDAITRVYHSKNPLEFGVNEDKKHLVGTLPIAAPEIIFYEGQYYVAALLPSLKGIQIAKMQWVSNGKDGQPK